MAGLKRKLEGVELPRKKLKKQIKRILKHSNEKSISQKRFRRQLEVDFDLMKKALDPRKTEIKELVQSVRDKMEAKEDQKTEENKSEEKEKTVVPKRKRTMKIIGPPVKYTKPVPKKPISSNLSAEDIAWRKEQHVTVENPVDLAPYLLFSKLEIEEKFAVGYTGFEKPTPIQAQSWPFTLPKDGKQGQDCIGVAETGSGKTLAFILPAVIKLFSSESMQYKPRALVLAPTRELAQQIEATIKTFEGSVGVRSICVFGGAPKWPQQQAFRDGVDIIVATPGRLLAFVREGEVDLSEVEYVVLDEADRMLEKGFVPDVTEIVDHCQPKGTRQTMLFSATWPVEVQKLGRSFLESPVKIKVSNSKQDELSTVSTVTQEIRVMQHYEREDRLWELLTKHKSKKIIVFGLYKKECANLEWSVKDWGFNCVSLHGNKDQRERTKCLKIFRDNTSRILIATDVASRGLDVKDVDMVVNFSFPLTIEDYVHRIGRTGRAGKMGDSITFFTQRDKLLARGLIELLEKSGETPPKELFKLRCAKRFKRRH